MMDFLNVSRLNLTHYQNQSVPQTLWMFPTNLSVSSINTIHAWLVCHQRYGDQKSHQNTKHPIMPMIFTKIFLIMQILANVFFPRSLLGRYRTELLDIIYQWLWYGRIGENLKIGKNIDDPNRNDIIQIIQKYWDCFCKEGARRIILGYEFSIDTGDSKPVFCEKPAYGLYESKIFMGQVQQILANGWAKQFKGPWGSLIVIIAKPHQ